MSDPERRSIGWMSLVALVLSISALLVSVFEVAAIRSEQRVQVWPYLQLDSRFTSQGYGIDLTNKGIGPARVVSVELRLGGEVVDELDELIVRSIGKEDAFSYELYRTSDPAGGVMSADEQATLFAVPWEPRTRRLADVWSRDLKVRVCYCSVYDECWIAELNQGDPASVNRCPPAD